MEAVTYTRPLMISVFVHIGYCEVCHVTYQGLVLHLSSQGHREKARSPDKYARIDNLINHGDSLQAFAQRVARRRGATNGWVYIGSQIQSILYLVLLLVHPMMIDGCILCEFYISRDFCLNHM